MQETLYLQDILKIIKKNTALMVLITIVITLIMVVYVKVFTVPTYQASTKLFVGKEGGAETYYDSSDITLYKNLLATYSEVAQTKELVKKALNNSKYEKMDENSVLAHLTVNTVVDTQIIRFNYTSANKEDTAEILTLLTDEFIDESKKLVGNSKISVIEPAEVPKYAVSNNSSLKIVVGFCLGIMISLIVIFFKEYLNDTYDDGEALQNDINIPVLAVIPYAKLKEEN